MLKRVFFIRRINHSRWGTLSVIIQSISLRLGVYNSRTRTYVRLLGPCFKTGRITTPITSRWTNESRRKPKSIAPPWRKQKKSKSRLQTNKNNLSSVNQLRTPKTCTHEQGSVTTRKPTLLKACYSLSPNDFTYFSHSFQIPFHLSLTVLVRYRSPGNI